jgi:GT2 family glycosyltransferase
LKISNVRRRRAPHPLKHVNAQSYSTLLKSRRYRRELPTGTRNSPGVDNGSYTQTGEGQALFPDSEDRSPNAPIQAQKASGGRKSSIVDVTPNISVIVPLYNKAPYITRCLRSILSQTYGNFEIIVVDDGSTDEGAALVRAYSDPRIFLISQTNRGPGAARNRGIARARGELIAFIDADDEWLPQYLEKTDEVFRHYGPSISAVTWGYYESPGMSPLEAVWRSRGLQDGPFTVRQDTCPVSLVAALAYMSPCSTTARAALIRRLGGFFEGNRCLYGEDAYLWLKVLMNGLVVFSLKPLVVFHRDASALSNNLRAGRPVEPFLIDPSPIEAACPIALRPLLGEVLAIRAFKTACVVSYWGDWREASALRSRFASRARFKRPYFFASMLCATPLGPFIGRMLRLLKSVLHYSDRLVTRAATLCARSTLG